MQNNHLSAHQGPLPVEPGHRYGDTRQSASATGLVAPPALPPAAMALAPKHLNRPRPLLFAAAAMLFVFVFLPGSAATTFEYCNKRRGYPVKVSGVEVAPDPVVRGQPATFKISAYTDRNITKGKLVVDVAYFIFHVHSETHNLCDQISCPATGEFVLAGQHTLPSFTPPGSYTITMKLLGDSNKELTCISFGFSIGFITPNPII
ncbi:hypothetical protein BS78_01G056300 [Paspalum vaginatum]|nr:hypothetical protein BS78_01G056300 [Paspalum vaginatum]